MDDLARFQREMGDAFRRLTQTDKMASHIRSSGLLTGVERIKIYHDSICAALMNALKSTYPACLALVGHEFFSALCYRYIAKKPSCSPDLNDYGADFDQFLSEFEPAQSLPYFPDMARLEWAWHQMLFCVRHEPQDLTALTEMSEAQLATVRFTIPESAVLLVSDYPLQAMWELCVGQQAQTEWVMVDSSTKTSPDIDTNENENDDTQRIDLNAGGVRLLLYRDYGSRQMEALSEPEFYLLSHIHQGELFAELSESYLAQNFAVSFDDVFARCAVRGWLTFSK